MTHPHLLITPMLVTFFIESHNKTEWVTIAASFASHGFFSFKYVKIKYLA